MSAGDITLSVPKTTSGVLLGEMNIAALPSPLMVLTFFEGDARGPSHVVSISNSAVGGFDLAGGGDNLQRLGLTNYLTTILGVLFVGNASNLNARKTALVQRLVTDGVITGTVTVA